MREPQTDFGKELRRLRLEAGYSQTKLSELAGITSGYISQLETGDKHPTLQIIRILSQQLDVKPNHLFIKIGMMEMNLGSSLVNNRDRLNNEMPNLPQDQLEELAIYLTYLEFKASTLE